MDFFNLSCVPSEKGIDNSLLFKNKIWRIDDVAGFLGVSVGHIYNLISASKKMRRKDEIPYRKRGKALYFFPQEILDWIDEGR